MNRTKLTTILLFLLPIVLLTSCGDLKSRMDDIEARMAALEKQCDRMNSDLAALRSIVNVLDQADFIKGVTPVTAGGEVIGYTLEFRNSPSITIYHGTDGKDGKDAPRIGIRKDGDGYYWTLDGEWLLDEQGRRIPVSGRDGTDGRDGADGITPQLKIEDGIWWVSYDNGLSWSELGAVAPMVVADIREDANYVYITLSSGTEIKLPKVGSVISFEDPMTKMLCVKRWDANKDGELSFDEAAAVTSLGETFQGAGITYFNELAYFSGLEAIDDNAFNKSGIQEVTLPAKLKAIGMRAFYATPLRGIAIPESVESVGRAAFYACRVLERANIPSGMTEVPRQMFAGCWKLQSIVLPEGTTKIGDQAFLECFEMADVALPAVLDTIGESAFSKCNTFTEMIMPQSVRCVGQSCFHTCDNLAHVEIPEGVKVLDHMVLHSCHAMESFTVPSSIEQIGWFTFWDCINLRELVMLPSVPPSVRTDNGSYTLFKDCPEDLVIRVPDVATYESDPYWSRYTGMFQALE